MYIVNADFVLSLWDIPVTP